MLFSYWNLFSKLYVWQDLINLTLGTLVVNIIIEHYCTIQEHNIIEIKIFS